ncbi:transposase [Sorangium cellulosum]|uniref:Transposase n=1 Tax=Sorangium cellulosum TaxID=56 RepID=A0A4P2QCF8_SORCE|nr:transposase [Sorangium cellulosum]AUX27434.1 transposase [Sorangium cellulosum]
MRGSLRLRPDAAINQLLVYALAVSARRYGVEVHALCAMSTHLHLVVTDVHGVLPRFLQFFHRLVALGTKVLRKWEGPVWDHEPTSVVRLLTQAAMVEKIAYVLANPVAAGLVRHAREWPGIKVDAGELGRGVLHATRPSAYLDPENPQWIEQATLPLALPPDIDHEAAEGFRHQVAAELERLEAQAHAEAERQEVGFLGAERASEVSPYERATSFERQRVRNPTFAVGREQGDACRAAAATVRAFRSSYRAALERWRADVRSALFPAGTWWMRVFHGASVSSACAIDVTLAA